MAADSSAMKRRLAAESIFSDQIVDIDLTSELDKFLQHDSVAQSGRYVNRRYTPGVRFADVGAVVKEQSNAFRRTLRRCKVERRDLMHAVLDIDVSSVLKAELHRLEVFVFNRHHQALIDCGSSGSRMVTLFPGETELFIRLSFSLDYRTEHGKGQRMKGDGPGSNKENK